MVLKMKKFLIQWRKFESKKSSRNEVMILLDFIFDVSSIFWIYFLKKIMKRVLIVQDPRKADVARGRHVAEPREPTWTNWTPMWREE